VIISKGKIVEEGTANSLKHKYNNDNLEDIFMRLVGDHNE